MFSFHTCNRLEEFDKAIEEMKAQVMKAMEHVDMEEVEKLDAEAQFKAKKHEPNMNTQKNQFRYRRADFRRSPAYEKCYPRPPTPVLSDYDDPYEANQKLTSWMEAIYKKFPRSDWPLFICQDEDITELKKSKLYKDYCRMRTDGLISQGHNINRSIMLIC